MEEGNKLHAVMLPLPLSGHINPMLNLSCLLASKGFTITFVSTALNRNVSLPAAEPAWDIRFAHISDGLPPDHGRPVRELLDSAINGSMIRNFEDLMRRIVDSHDQRPPISCIIASSFIHRAQDVARKLGLPFVSFWSQSAASYTSVSMVAKGYRPPEGAEFITGIPGVPALRVEEFNTFLTCYDEGDFMFDVFVRPFQRLGESDWVLLNTFEELEGETMAAIRQEHERALAVGPLLPPWYLSMEGGGQRTARARTYGSAHASKDREAISVRKDINHGGGQLAEEREEEEEKEEEEHILEWLDGQEEGRVVYVCFGTLATVEGRQMEELAHGLEAGGQPFLWVVRKGQVLVGGPDMTDGDHQINDSTTTMMRGFVERTRGRGLVVGWAPQVRVLRHPAVGGFLTHSGWNSTLEGLSAGLPLLAFWVIGDQATNGRCACDAWRVGLSLDRHPLTGLVSRDEVTHKIALLMSPSSSAPLRAAAAHWKHAAQRAAAAASIDRFVDSIRSLKH